MLIGPLGMLPEYLLTFPGEFFIPIAPPKRSRPVNLNLVWVPTQLNPVPTRQHRLDNPENNDSENESDKNNNEDDKIESNHNNEANEDSDDNIKSNDNDNDDNIKSDVDDKIKSDDDNKIVGNDHHRDAHAIGMFIIISS